MSEKDYFHEGRDSQIRNWVTSNMLMGAGWAALSLVIFGVIYGAIYAVSLMLPAESKTAPSPFGALDEPAAIIATV